MGVRLSEVATSPAPPPFAQPFDLHIGIRVAPGLVVTVPDTFATSDAFASTSPFVLEHSGRAPGDSIDLRLRYPVILLLDGPVSLPPLSIQLAPARAAAADPAAVLVRQSEDSTAAAGGRAQISLALGMVQVALPDSIAEATGAIPPREPVGPVGGEWSPWMLLAIASALLAAGLTAWLVLRKPGGADAAGPARLDRRGALRELDELRERGLHRSGRMRDFYTGLTDILRRFGHTLEPGWEPGWTSLELTAALERQRQAQRQLTVRGAVQRAESVKFGRFDASPEEADEDWTTVRRWVAEAPAEP
jgi:hypothetical protein